MKSYKVGKELLRYDDDEYLNETVKNDFEYEKEWFCELFNLKPDCDFETFLDAYLSSHQLSVDFDLYWDDINECLTELMKKKNTISCEYWYCSVRNFGWRNLNGYKYIRAEKGKDLLCSVLPRTDCTFKVFNYGNGFTIQNWHHDSPTGNEWYYIVPISASVYQNASYKGHLKED